MDIIYTIDFKSSAENDLEKLAKSGQLKLIEKAKTMIIEIRTSPKTGIGKPEILKGFSDRLIYSRRIDQKHRLVYEILEEEKIIKILSAYGHYKDK